MYQRKNLGCLLEKNAEIMNCKITAFAFVFLLTSLLMSETFGYFGRINKSKNLKKRFIKEEKVGMSFSSRYSFKLSRSHTYLFNKKYSFFLAKCD